MYYLPLIIKRSYDITVLIYILCVKGLFYGPLEFEGQTLTVEIGSLICKPNLDLEKQLMVHNRFSAIEAKIKSSNEAGTSHKEELDDLKVHTTYII